MKQMNTNAVYIHNAMQALEGFTFPGIEDYASRALTNQGGIAIIAKSPHMSEESIRTILEYYSSIGLGVDGVLCLPVGEDGDLYPGLQSENACKAINSFIDEGYRIQFFNTRAGMEEEVIRKLGLDWNKNTISIPSKLADLGNNKAHVRRVAQDLKLGTLFPQHRIVSGFPDLVRAFHAMRSEYGEVVIKLPAWASGLGMAFGNSNDVLAGFVYDHSNRLNNVIVERSLGAHHVSMTIVKRFVDGQEVDSWITNQDCLQRDGAVSHVGSVLGELPFVTSEDAAWMQSATAPLYKHFLAKHPTLTGVINWDCIKGESGERYVLEGNFRVTFSTYIRSIQLSLAHTQKSLPGSVTCIVQKVHPRKEITSFAHLKHALGTALLQDAMSAGVIPIVLPCLTRNGYCYFVAVGDSYADALCALEESLERTCSQKRLVVS
ncbi:MAG: hypothetical protein AAB400_02205 [Patescibacteria group bacterium]